MKTKFRFLSILLVYVMIISQSAQYINSYAMSKDEYDSWKIAYINISDTTTANILKNIDTTTSTSLFSTVGFRSVSGNMVLKNQFLEVAVSENGRFTIGTTGGNLKTSDDDNKIMLYNHPNPHTSYTTVKIDGQDYEFNASRVHGGSAIQNIQGIEIQQKLSFVENPHTDNKDMVEIKYIMTNRSSEEKDAGIRIMLDTMLGENDGTPFRIDGVGECTQEMEFIGNNIPKSWRAFDSLISPKVISSGIFFMNEGERPDKVQFADWRSITDIKWEYEVMGRDITMDSAVAIYFNPKLLKSGQSITVTTYYGINEFSAEDLRPPLAIKLHDVKKAKLNSTGIAYNPITITAYIENIDRDTAKNVVAELELPNGMKIRGNEKTIVNLGDVSKRTSRQISWNVDIEPQSIDKKLKYNVVLTADNTQKKIISSDIEIPKVKIKTGIIMIHGILGGEIYAAHDVNSKYFLEGKVNGFLLRDKDYPMHYRYWVPESVTGTINDAVLNKSSIQTDVLMIMTNENGKPMTPTKAVDLNTDDDLYGADNTYGPLMQGLQDKFSTKYGKDNIHFFTYDWRMSIDEAGDKLEEFINKKKYDEVIIVAHSMGGLVASSYIQKSEMNRNKVSKLITMGTPYLGAPKALYVLGTGNMFDAEKNLVMAKPLKIMAPNLISAYELLPTEKYFSLNSTYYLAHMQWKSKDLGILGDKSEKIPVAMNYAQTTSMINNVFSKGRDIYNSAQKVHDKLFRFDGKHISSNIDTYYIIGYNINTIGKVGVEYRNGNYEKLIDIINNLQGDGTVPLISADIGNTVSAEKTYYVIEEHGALPKNNDVIKLVNKIIENDKPVSQKGVISQSNITQDRPTIKHNSRKIRIECPVDVDIYKDGEHMGGIIDNAPYKNDVKSNIGVYSLGDNNDIKIIYIAEENKYDINLTATDDGKMTYTMETLDEFTGDTLKKIRFTDVKLAKGMKIYTDTLEPTYLSIDTNADGNIDKKISPDYDSSITHNIVIKATEGGKILEGKSGEYPKDEILEISAQADKGYKFKGWTSTNGGIFDQENELLTYFLTPNNQTTIIANFEPVDKKTNINQKSNSSRNSENSEKDDRGVSNNENQKEYSSEYFEHTLEKSSYSYVPIYYVNGEAKLIKWSAILNGNLVFFKETEKDIDIKDMKKEFSDIQNHSSKNSIDFVSSREILVGVDKNKFMPNEKVTRATLLSLLARLDNEDLSKYNYIKFKDVKPNSWYSNSVSWAYENNIMSGYGKDKFAPNDIITAEQLAVALYNYMKYKNIELPIDETVQINIENTSSWAREKLKLVYQMGLMSSLKNRFKEKLSRAEISEIFEEFIRVVIKNKALK